MSAQKPLLYLVQAEKRVKAIARVLPIRKLTMDEKRAEAVAYLRERGKYILDRNAPKPSWGVPQAGAKK